MATNREVDNQWKEHTEDNNRSTAYPIEEYNMFAHAQLREFGPAVFMYFSLLLSGFLLLAVCAAIYSPAISMYLSVSDELTATSADGPVEPALQGCAISRYIKHPTLAYKSTYEGVQRYENRPPFKRSSIAFIDICLKFLPLSHSADLGWMVALPDLMVCALLLAFCAATSALQSRLLRTADDAQQTARDYAIAITNPPRSCGDPLEYKRHFEGLGYGAVVGVTIRLVCFDRAAAPLLYSLLLHSWFTRAPANAMAH
jgi:hypothetical protein